MKRVRPIILGQAPSRLGDGRPFTGPSGDTICKWAGVESREKLLEYFELDNLLSKPLPVNGADRRSPSAFSPTQARAQAGKFLERQRVRLRKELGQSEYNDFIDSGEIVVVALGTKVWRSFRLPRNAEVFDEQPVSAEFRIVRFPHPSGLNHQLNDSEFVANVQRRLREIGHISLD